MSEPAHGYEWERASGPFGVLLVRTAGFIDGTFEYLGNGFPVVGEEIGLTQPGGAALTAKVTGIERAKWRPIRAVEL